MKYDVSQIKRIASCLDLCRAEGIELSVNGFMCCPAHSEKTGSCRVWRDHVHCYGCGWHGDVIDLAVRLWECTFSQAIERLAGMYGLAPEKDSEIMQRYNAEEQERRQKAERINRLRDDYFARIAEYRALDNSRAKYAPRSPTDTLHPLFVESLRRLDAAEQAMKEAEWALHDAERR